MFRRKKKLYFQKTVSKFPLIIFIASVIVGSFFLFKIVSTLVRESDDTVDIAVVEIKTETHRTPQEVFKKPVESPKTQAEKPVPTIPAIEQTKLSPDTEFFTIQVATFSDRKRTENLAEQLKEKKFSPVYIKTRGKLLEVCVGNYSAPQEGRETLLKIRKDFHDAFIRRMHPPFEEK